MNLALFDLDNTLLSADTDTEWFAFLGAQGVLTEGEQEQTADMDRRYRDGVASALEYVRFYLRPYPRHDMARLLAWRDAFLRERITPRILPRARELLASHRNDLTVIITATNSFLTEPIAQAFEVEHLIATEPEIVDGRFTGDVVGEPCMRGGKVERLRAWLAERGASLSSFRESWFYSDSINDLPLLEHVTHPVAVDPDARLEAHARSRGWPSISLRAPPAGER